MTVVTKRSSMTFFSDPSDLMSHRVRVVLFEKGVTVEVIDCDLENVPEEVLELNPTVSYRPWWIATCHCSSPMS